MIGLSARHPKRVGHKCTQCALCSYVASSLEQLDDHFRPHLLPYLADHVLSLDVQVAEQRSTDRGDGGRHGGAYSKERQDGEIGDGGAREEAIAPARSAGERERERERTHIYI
eukprot:2364583-Pyramimonas_sp.AAC.1